MKEDLAAIIKRMRKGRGITQRELAEKLGITAQAVSKWERGDACPDIFLLPALAAVFGVTTDEILGYNREE
ncbi:MAG: helix-turn-helix transcriptional regulator [Ruminococcaceae bacterium]|nr:helix-turn-helix transcriptional regulator [Oscillospiraceae bacterium]